MRPLPPALLATLLPVFMLAGCAASLPAPSPLPTATVPAAGETEAVATANADAADDPAIWRNPADPAASLIVGTDKKAGLYVYDMTGKVRQFVDAGRVNNVDLVEAGGMVLVAASDRTDPANAHVALFRLDTVAARLEPLARLPAGPGEAYGLCLWAAPEGVQAYVVMKSGAIRQLALGRDGTTATPVRTLGLATQSEGCVVDAARARLYVAEEDVGIWEFDARAAGATTPTRFAAADGKTIVADAEGLAIAPDAGGAPAYLVASSQGDNAYAVFRLADRSYAGRFRIGGGPVGATEETDGIAIAAGDFGGIGAGGLMVAQDGRNAPRAQNFKLVSWQGVRTALGLP